MKPSERIKELTKQYEMIKLPKDSEDYLAMQVSAIGDYLDEQYESQQVKHTDHREYSKDCPICNPKDQKCEHDYTAFEEISKTVCCNKCGEPKPEQCDHKWAIHPLTKTMWCEKCHRDKDILENEQKCEHISGGLGACPKCGERYDKPEQSEVEELANIIMAYKARMNATDGGYTSHEIAEVVINAGYTKSKPCSCSPETHYAAGWWQGIAKYKENNPPCSCVKLSVKEILKILSEVEILYHNDVCMTIDLITYHKEIAQEIHAKLEGKC